MHDYYIRSVHLSFSSTKNSFFNSHSTVMTNLIEMVNYVHCSFVIFLNSKLAQNAGKAQIA